MRPAMAMLIVGALSLSCTAPASRSPSLGGWDACEFVTGEDVARALPQNWTSSPGIADVPWQGRLAQTRCEYMAGDFRSIVVYAEASNDEHPAEARVKDVLVDEGYRIKFDLPPSTTAEGGSVRGFWVTVDAEGGHHRGELHLFFDRDYPSRPGDGAIPARPRRLHAYVVLYLTDLPLFTFSAAEPGAACALPGQETTTVVACKLLPTLQQKVWQGLDRLSVFGQAPPEQDAGVMDVSPDRPEQDSPDGPGPDAGEAGLPLQNFTSEVAFRFCRRQHECCSATERAGGLTSDGETACLLQFATALDVLVAGTTPSLAAGRMAYDGARASDCIGLLDSAACDELKQGQPTGLPCLDAFRPSVPLGGACTSHLECTTGLCRAGAPGAGTICEERRASGELCDLDEACVTGQCSRTEGKCLPAEPAPWCRGF